MSEQPTALRLAQILTGPDGLASWHREDAAAELRRLHDHTQMLDNAYRAACEVIRQQETVNAELLEALQDLCDTLGECGMTEKARAAIAKAEGEPK